MEPGQERKIRKQQEDLARLNKLRPIDDDFMRCLFRGNLKLAQMVLRILTGVKDLTLTSIETQADMKRLLGVRSICLDAYGHDDLGKAYDIEVQRADTGAGAHRARYHSSVLDIDNLNAGQGFNDLPDTYVIFITENDLYGRGEAFYPIERVNMVTGELFGDGEHILYVNGAYRGDDDIGRLMHDFFCKDASEMYYPDMAEATRYYKETEEGRLTMSKIIEDMLSENEQELTAQYLASMTETLKLSIEQAMDALRIPQEKRSDYMTLLQSAQ